MEPRLSHTAGAQRWRRAPTPAAPTQKSGRRSHSGTHDLAPGVALSGRFRCSFLTLRCGRRHPSSGLSILKCVQHFPSNPFIQEELAHFPFLSLGFLIGPPLLFRETSSMDICQHPETTGTWLFYYSRGWPWISRLPKTSVWPPFILLGSLSELLGTLIHFGDCHSFSTLSILVMYR